MPPVFGLEVFLVFLQVEQVLLMPLYLLLFLVELLL